MSARRTSLAVLVSLMSLIGGTLALAPVAFAVTPPAIEEEAVTNVSDSSATLVAKINPKGSETTYRFEYGTSEAYGSSVPVPDGLLGSGSAGLSISAHIQGLSAGTLYHYRVVASVPSRSETVDGADHTFTTQSTGAAFALPDSREWEMVSPPQKEGALLGWISEGIVQASADGNAFTDWSFFEPIEEKAAGAYGFGIADFFGRGPSGWSSKTIVPPHSAAGPAPVGNGNEYRMFSEDLSKGILQPFGPATPLVPEVSESTPYIHTDYLNGNPGELCGSGCFQPIVSPANVPPGTKFGEELNGEPCNKVHCGPEVLGTTPDFSHIVLSSGVSLTSTPAGRKGGLYEWGDGHLKLIGILPETEGGELAEGVEFGGEGSESERSTRHAISNDGSRIVLAAGFPRHLYLRDTGAAATVRLDLPNTGVTPPREASAEYMTASSDVSRIFFLDPGRLTQDSTASEGRKDLYEYNVNAPAGSRLTDLTVDGNAGETASVHMVPGASEDGSYVYFIADGALAPGATPGECFSTHCNLYVRHNGTTTFIAALSVEDSPDWSHNLAHLTVRVSPNGQWIAFMSNRRLTAYDNTDAISGRPDQEVYLYGAQAAKLTCASCNPTGARPVGVEYGNENKIVNADRVFETTTWIAANVPPWTRYDLRNALYQSRYLSNSGRLFFDSHDALVPQDVNGTQDVYQYEPPGVGDCAPSKTTFSQSSGGCVATVSSGTSNEESAFLDASESGGDVFFLTGGKLLPQDFDNALDIYDARECVPASRCIARASTAPPPCSTEASCRPSPTPQPSIFGSPASSTFSGAGNAAPSAAPSVRPRRLTGAQKLARALGACHKKRKRKLRAACERKARARYAASKSRKANATKRGGR